MNRRIRDRRQRETAELNITAFMNLMVILVPFLLITAVFSRLAVLELNLPAGSEQSTEQEEARLNLEVVIRTAVIEVGDRRTGILKSFPASESGYDYQGLTAFLREVKARHPDVSEAALLLEPDVDYDTLVQVMDAVRVVAVDNDEAFALAELFPDISIGDAPIHGADR